MSNKTREELRAIFVTEAKPTQTDFHNWLDSYIHQADQVLAGNIADDTSHRFVTDAQIATWNGKQDAIIPSEDHGTTGYYYVRRKYSGAGQAYITSVGAWPVSPNPDYMVQLQAARRGDMANAYPDPYAAQSAALADIAAGTVTKAYIITEAGQRWTVGSNDPLKNGDANGNPSIPTDADIQFAAAGNTFVANLLNANITHIFGEDAGFTYINKTYAICLGYISNPSSTIKTEVNILGRGKFIQIYGENEGFVASLMYINDPNVRLTHSYKELMLNMYIAFRFENVCSNIMRVEKCFSYECEVTDIRSSVQGLDPQQVHDIEFGTLTWGNIPTAPMAAPKNDSWYCFYIQYNAMPSRVNIRIRNMYQQATADSCLLRSINRVASDQHVVITIDNYYHTAVANAKMKSIMAVNLRGITNQSYVIHLKEAYIESALAQSYDAYPSVVNSFVKLRCDHIHINNQSTPACAFQNILQGAYPNTNCFYEIQGTFNLLNGSMYSEDINGTTTGTLALFKNATITSPSSNTANIFEKTSSTNNCLMLDNVTINCANTKTFANLSGGTPKIFLKSVATTDTTPNATITYEGEPIITIPAGYFK